MPWTRKQVKYLMSIKSPLTRQERAKMVSELHANPEMGHAKKKPEPKTTEDIIYDRS